MRDMQPLRIAVIVGVFPALSETFILNQIIGLIDHGHRVDIFAQSKLTGQKAHQKVIQYDLLSRTRYFFELGHKWSHLLKTIFDLTINRQLINYFKTAKRYRLGRKSAWCYAAPFLSHRYDVIYCHFGPNGVIGAFLKELGVQTKLVVSFHGYDLGASISSKYGNYYQLFEKTDMVTANSEYTKNKLVKIGYLPEKIEILRMGVDIDDFHFSEKKTRYEDKVVLLTVARLIEKKGLEYSIRAASRLVQLGYNIEYKIIGDGPFKEYLVGLIAALGLKQQVSLLGWCDQDQIKISYEQAHLFILPSFTDYDGNQEAQGIVLQEAQACGLPVIASNIGGIPEGIRDGVSGFLVHERDVDALTDKLEYLIKHREIWPEMGRAGRSFVEENYDNRRLIKKLINTFKEVKG